MTKNQTSCPTKRNVAIIGLGYVGLPLAMAFARQKHVIAFDVNAERVHELKRGLDRNQEIILEHFQGLQIHFTHDQSDLEKADFYIVTVPTPVTAANTPDMSLVLKASRLVGAYLKKGDVIVYESTVYPGATEEECLPLLEEVSNLVAGKDFFIGYSPERINPGDKEHQVEDILKVVSAQDQESTEMVAKEYESIIRAGVYRASSIQVAEAAKVIENTQRDINIAFMNELSMIFDRLNISTAEVLEAAQTKWNFLPFKPGLVGGHCIGVDPYYLTYKAEQVGHKPQMILSGRRINESMGSYIAQKTIKLMIQNGSKVVGEKIIILGLTFKENCSDIRNSKVIDIITELQSFNIDVQVFDPCADPREAQEHYGIKLLSFDELQPSSAIVTAVSHERFSSISFSELESLSVEKPLLIDIKSIWKQSWPSKKRGTDYVYWAL